MGQVALQYVRRGWPVFPCRECDGAPYVRRGSTEPVTPRAKSPYVGKGLNDATRDEQRVLAWWRQHPNALIGLPMGVNGCFALDFDPRVEEVTDPDTGEVIERREWTLEQLKADLEAQMGCALPPSLTSRTPSGGVHVWFRQPGEGDPVRNRGNLPQHVDVRGLGGYVIGPPSAIVAPVEHASIGEYRWINKRGDWRNDADIADAPPALIEILRAPKAPAARPTPPRAPTDGAAPPARRSGDDDDPVERARRKWALAAFDHEIAAAEQLPRGTRNNGISAAALKLGAIVGAGYLSEAMVRGALYQVAALWEDVDKTCRSVDSALAKGKASPRDMADIGTQAAPITAQQRARLIAVTAAWAVRRCKTVQRDAEAIRRLAFGIGRRIGEGLIEAAAAKELLWAVYEHVPDIDHGAIDRAIDDGAARGFDVGPLLLHERCAGFPMTDFGIAERFHARFGHDFRFTTAKGWLGWDGRRWKVLDQEKDAPPAEVIGAVFETVRLIQDEARYVADSGVKLELVQHGKEWRLADDEEAGHALDHYVPKGKGWVLWSDLIKAFGRASETSGKPAAIAALARKWLTVPIEAFDRDPLAINVMNGTLRFRRETLPDGTRSAGCTLDAHSRDDMNTKLAPVEYLPDAPAPIYDDFFAWAHPDAPTRRYLHQVLGYAATGDVGEQKLWFHYGLGANGKSTWIDLVARVLGDYSGTIGIETFLDQGIKKRGEQASPDLAKLGGVRFLRASEPERGAKLNEALIKAATGGEPMAVRALHRGFFDLMPLFKLMISGNYKPDIPGTDEGIWRRVKLVPWNAHRKEGERDDKLPDKLWGEAAGVFNHVVRGLLDWLANGLVEPEAVREATAQYREDSDPLARFLKMCTEIDPEARVQSSRLHEVFVAWAKAAGEREWTQKGFSQALKNKGFRTKHSNGMQWVGLKLTRQASDFVDSEGRVRDLDEPGDLAGSGSGDADDWGPPLGDERWPPPAAPPPRAPPAAGDDDDMP